jgi:hypothetical protein
MKEDEMATNIKVIDFYTSSTAIVAGDRVVLRANLSDFELDRLIERGGTIKYSVGTTALTPNQDPRSATWNTAGATVGEHTAKVEITVDNKTTTKKTKIYVLDDAPIWRPAVNIGALKVVPTPASATVGTPVALEVTDSSNTALDPNLLTAWKNADLRFDWDTGKKGIVEPSSSTAPAAFAQATWQTVGMNAGTPRVVASLVDSDGKVLDRAGVPITATGTAGITAVPSTTGDPIKVALQRSSAVRTRDQAFWALIRSCTTAMNSRNYFDFIERVLCREEGLDNPAGMIGRLSRQARELHPFSYGVGAYELLKTATQVFLLLECGGCHADIKNLDAEDESRRFGETITVDQIRDRLRQYLTTGHLPYIDRVLDNAFRGEREIAAVHCYGVLTSRIQVPCLLELIWSYWHEEGMLVQTINAITRRFQNVRRPGDRDPLAHLEIDPLRPLNNLLWGYIQDEQNLLTLKRRAYEYDHHYGLTIYGKAVPTLRPADSRSKFLEAFHNLLHRTSIFYKEDNDTTVIADGFPLLNALREVHLLLAQGAHNQFGDLPWTARAEMLIQQWLLGRPEMRDFLQSRHMVPYQEPWMAPVDTMKTLQAWSDVTVTHFRDLGIFGEQILLTIRYGDWIDINDEDAARNWARYWRPEIQGYLHAYRAVTGIDLTNPDTVDHTMPAVHLQKRLAMQRVR